MTTEHRKMQESLKQITGTSIMSSIDMNTQFFTQVQNFEQSRTCKNYWGNTRTGLNLKKILRTGVEYGFKQDLIYSEETRIKDLKASLERGNNKSALEWEHLEFIKENYS